jgi:hypothetical protein
MNMTHEELTALANTWWPKHERRYCHFINGNTFTSNGYALVMFDGAHGVDDAATPGPRFIEVALALAAATPTHTVQELDLYRWIQVHPRLRVQHGHVLSKLLNRCLVRRSLAGLPLDNARVSIEQDGHAVGFFGDGWRAVVMTIRGECTGPELQTQAIGDKP